ncbi:hypothetical protein AGABI1DRAFT_108492 [Agaricus bisporus var. burnettii JB137-S8]|uniref:Hydrophobic surface binding protein n=1 Tax=Agaricus bisporus var. burnettii (strain JB137-S8 / ATCC MYA-4627 / FGSC 10392) TaxID=597362 RepID=K5X1S0_AGABU|nr:uncharacterized protein AGABI1DRAFT_108492 [Agaricus bisporus var. burnettii JB137-S8]EKM76862.1 hypothetical protein AGABI1DRAFT_108492 [Agaricus bisporus var. burnettii JB137-S8]
MQLKSLVYLGSAFTLVFGATTQDVLNDINTLRSRLNTLDNDLHGFSGGILDALAIHNAATSVQSATDDTTSDVQDVPTPISEADAQSILDAITGIAPIIKDSLTTIVAKKSDFESVPLGGISIARGDLNNLAGSTSNLEDALIASTPADLLDEANAIRNEIDAAFAAAIAAF